MYARPLISMRLVVSRSDAGHMRPAPGRDAALLERGDVRSTAVRKLCELSADFRTEHTDLWGRYRVGRSGSGVREICQPLLFLNKREAQDVTLVALKRVGDLVAAAAPLSQCVSGSMPPERS